VNAFVVNKAGLLLVPTRSLKKKVAPGGMDYSAAEHVLSGESYDDAMVRGFNEEIGLQVNPSMFTLLGVLPPTATKPFFDAVYVLLDYAGKDPVLNRDEFVSSEWLTIDEIKRRITTATTPQKVSLLPALELLTRKIG
jgi:isopentenyldiphosphate isomerase